MLIYGSCLTCNDAPFEVEEELVVAFRSVAAAANGLTKERSGLGPPEAILLHKLSQLLITSVSLPFSSPSSTCNSSTESRTVIWLVVDNFCS